MKTKLNSKEIIQSYLDYCEFQNTIHRQSSSEQVVYYILKKYQHEYEEVLSLYTDKDKLLFPNILPEEVFQEFHKGIRNSIFENQELSHIMWLTINEARLFINHLNYHAGCNIDDMHDLS